MKDMPIDVLEVSELVEYAPEYESGLKWKAKGKRGLGRQYVIGAMAGKPHKDFGYFYVHIKGKKYRTHRVVCALHGLDVLNMQVDHIDGDRSNNRIENLRVVGQIENGRNQKMKSTNKTGFVGLSRSYHSGGFHWKAHWRVNQKTFSKAFAVTKHGEWGAFAKACEARKLGLIEAQKDGIKYSNRHLGVFA